MEVGFQYINVGIAAFSFLICLCDLYGISKVYVKGRKTIKYFFYLVFFQSISILAVFTANLASLVIADKEQAEFVAKCGYAAAFCTYYMVVATFVFYAFEFISEDVGQIFRPIRYTIPVATIDSIMWMISAFNGMIVRYEGGRFYRGPLYYLGQVGGYILIMQPFAYMFKYRKNVSKRVLYALSSFIMMPIICTVLKSFYMDVNYMPFSLMISIEIIANSLLFEREIIIREQNEKLAQMRVELLLNQIKPHFLYNTLNAIYVLCEKDPVKAQEAIEDFSEFLRANLNNVGKEEKIAFSKEIELVKKYMNLEHIRYGYKLDVQYDLQYENFKIPAISVQILVENAVKHGLQRKEEGGTVAVKSYREDNQAIVEVTDDGVGFPEGKTIEEQYGIGLSTLAARIKTMSGGTVEIECEKDRGTCARIRIPIIEKT